MTALARARNLRAVTDRPSRAVIYVRQSTHKEESISLELQETACREYCARMGYVVVEVIPDPGITGRTWIKRAGVQKAMASVENGDAEIIVLWRWSRLSRRRLHWAVATDRIETIGGRIESATEPVDTATAAGKFARGMLGEVAAFESERIGEGWQEALESRRARGLPATGGRKYGYRCVRAKGEPERYEIEHDEAEILHWAYSEYLSGQGFVALVKDLNIRGVLNARDRAWKSDGLKRVLDAGFGAGLLARTPIHSDGREQYVPFADRTWDAGTHEPIIDDTVWRAYKAERVARGVVPPRTVNPTHVFSGAVKCGDCGSGMHRHTSTHRTVYISFRCGRARRVGDVRPVGISWAVVEDATMEFLAVTARDINEIADQMRQTQSLTRRTRADAEIVRRDILTIDKQLARLTRQMLAADESMEAAFALTRDELLADRKAEEARLAMIAEDDVPMPPLAYAADLLAEWHTFSADKRRNMLRPLIRAIWVDVADDGTTSADVNPTWEPPRPTPVPRPVV